MKLADFQTLRRDLATKTNKRGHRKIDASTEKTTLQLPAPLLVTHLAGLRDALGEKLDEGGNWLFYEPNQTATTLDLVTVVETPPPNSGPLEDSRGHRPQPKAKQRTEQPKTKRTPQQRNEAEDEQRAQRRERRKKELREEANALLVGKRRRPVQLVTAAWLRHLKHARRHHLNPTPLYDWFLDEDAVRDRLRRWMLSKQRLRTRYVAARDWFLSSYGEKPQPSGADADLMHAETELRYDWCFDSQKDRRISIYYCLDAEELKKEELATVRSVFEFTYKNILPKRSDDEYELERKASRFAGYLYRDYHDTNRLYELYGHAGDQVVQREFFDHRTGRPKKVDDLGFGNMLPCFYRDFRQGGLFGHSVPFPSSSQITPPDPSYPECCREPLDVAEIRTAMFFEPDFRYLDRKRMDAMYGAAVVAYVIDHKSFNPLRHLPKAPASYVPRPS